MWPAPRFYDILDRTIAIHLDLPALVRAVDDLLGHLTSDRRMARPADRFLITASDDGFAVFRDCVRLVDTNEVDVAVDHLLMGMNSHLVDTFDGFSAHAGVVVGGDGAIVLPGVSGQGKSTLTAACVRRGFEYISDEALAVGFGTRLALPYLKPINLSGWSRRAVGIGDDDGHERPVSPVTLGALATEPAEVAHIVIFDRGSDLSLEPAPGVTAVGELVRMGFTHYRNPRRTFETVSAIANGASVWRLRYSDPLEAADLLSERFGR